jgi:hypothetical protein
MVAARGGARRHGLPVFNHATLSSSSSLHPPIVVSMSCTRRSTVDSVAQPKHERNPLCFACDPRPKPVASYQTLTRRRRSRSCHLVRRENYTLTRQDLAQRPRRRQVAPAAAFRSRRRAARGPKSDGPTRGTPLGRRPASGPWQRRATGRPRALSKVRRCR